MGQVFLGGYTERVKSWQKNDLYTIKQTINQSSGKNRKARGAGRKIIPTPGHVNSGHEPFVNSPEGLWFLDYEYQ